MIPILEKSLWKEKRCSSVETRLWNISKPKNLQGSISIKTDILENVALSTFF